MVRFIFPEDSIVTLQTLSFNITVRPVVAIASPEIWYDHDRA